jgi:DNA-binding winged helix-turn-helix (wHTH) protein
VILAFGDCELDTELYELRRAGTRVHVEPQVFDVLAYLVEHRDHVVSKTEVLDKVWGDRFVSESALTSRIKAARRAVGDDGRDQHVIRTVRGRGYRFVATLTSRSGPSPSRPAPEAMPAVGLLKRDEALGVLTAALDDAAQGAGRVVLVGGEPGIGKTALVRAFVAQIADRARVLWGGCDDLITPRPFAPLHDLADAAGDLAAALATGAQAAKVHRLVLAELDLPPWPTVLVVEDAHWADEAPAEQLREIVEQSRARSAVYDIITNRAPITIEVDTR